LDSLDQLVQQIHKTKMLSEIEKLMFDRGHFARFLIANEFNVEKTLVHF
jgi:hypothetical protein